MVIVGLDIGTTNTCVTYSDKQSGEIKVLTHADGSDTLPSCVYFSKDDEEILVGTPAELMLSSSFVNRGVVVHTFKPLLGVKVSKLETNTKETWARRGVEIVANANDDIMLKIMYNKRVKYISIPDVMTVLLKRVRMRINEVVGKCDIRVVVTLPVDFNETQKGCVMKCLELAGFTTVLKLVQEPTAAAVTYAYNTKREEYNTKKVEGETQADMLEKSSCTVNDEEQVIVYNIGGGTTDLSLMTLDTDTQTFEVKSVVGNSCLGGDMITTDMVEYVLNCIKQKIPRISADLGSESHARMCRRVYKECEKVKKIMAKTDGSVYNIVLDNVFDGEDICITFTKAQYAMCCQKFLTKQKQIFNRFVSQCIHDESISSISSVSSVVLVGLTLGISLMKPIINELYNSVESRELKIYYEEPEFIVAKGACIQGLMMEQENVSFHEIFDTVLLEVVPLSIGVELANGIMSPIISRNTIIPARRSKTFANSESFCEEITISLYQGERRFAKDNIHIGEVILQGLDGNKQKGDMKIVMTLDIDAVGNLSVTAEDVGTKGKVSTQFNKVNVFDFDKKTLDRMLDVSEKTKLSDLKLSKQIQIKNDIEESLNVKLNQLKAFKQTSDNRYDMFNCICHKYLDTIVRFRSFEPHQLEKEKATLEKEWFDVYYRNIGMHDLQSTGPHSVDIFEKMRSLNHS